MIKYSFSILLNFILFLILIFNSYALTKDEDKKYDELEGFNFIRAIFNDKRYSDVIKYGRQVKVEINQTGDLNYFLAHSYYQTKNYDKALSILQSSELLNKTDTNQFFLTYAKVQYELKNFPKCIENFSRVNMWVLNADDWSLLSTCYETNHQPEKLIEIMINTNTGDFDLFLESQRILLKYGLHQIATDKRQAFLSKCSSENDFLSLLTLLEKNKIKDDYVLEFAHRCYNNSLELSSHLIKSHYQAGKFHSIAYSFSTLALNDPSFYKHTAEFYKISNRTETSDYFSSMSDEESSILFKASRYLQDENLALMFSLPLKTDALKNNSELLYAKAFSQLKYHQLNEVEKTVKTFKNKSSKEEGFTQLVSKCKELDWRCRP